MEQASKRLRITRKTMRRLVSRGSIRSLRAGTADKAPVLVSRREIERVLKTREGFIGDASLSGKLGLPIMVLQTLAEVGLFRKKVDPDGLVPGMYFAKDSVEDLLSRFNYQAQHCTTGRDLVNLRRAAVLAGSPAKNPWPAIFQEMLGGHIEFYSNKAERPFLGSFFVKVDAISSIADRADPWPEPEDRPPLTRADIGLLLDLPTPSVYGLIQDGILTDRPSLEEVQRFHATFILSKEAARILSLREDVADCDALSILSHSGLEPACTTTYKKRRVWRRSDVEQLVGTLTAT